MNQRKRLATMPRDRRGKGMDDALIDRGQQAGAGPLEADPSHPSTNGKDNDERHEVDLIQLLSVRFHSWNVAAAKGRRKIVQTVAASR